MEHHVYFWLNDGHQNDEARTAFEGGLKALFEIEEVGGGAWGKPAQTEVRPVTDNSWDYALSLKFDSQAQHDLYQVHAKHDEFVDQFKGYWDKVLVMDLEEVS